MENDFVYTIVKKKIKSNELINTFKTIFDGNDFIINAKITYTDIFFCFNMEDKKTSNILYSSDELFINPFILKIYFHNINKTEEYYIISKQDFETKINNLKFENPLFYCSLNKETNWEPQFFCLIGHYKCKGCHFIKDDIKFEKYNENTFNDFFKNYEECKDVYSLPDEFEFNYRDYFTYYEYTNKEFIIHKSINRRALIQRYEDSKIGKLNIFYGSPGRGKSITLLIFLKYYSNLNKFGTLYINCKTLYKLWKEKNYDKLKLLINNEIIFLFKNEFDKFKEFKKIINGINFEKNSFLNIIYYHF